MKYIERQEYMQRLLDLMGTPDIKIITGVRRSGKSELMKAYIRRIREMQPEANIIFVDFFDLKYARDVSDLHLGAEMVSLPAAKKLQQTIAEITDKLERGFTICSTVRDTGSILPPWRSSATIRFTIRSSSAYRNRTDVGLNVGLNVGVNADLLARLPAKWMPEAI